jgi:signal transduction histidine kinase/DNA-binding NarL/FixJ family response regulator
MSSVQKAGKHSKSIARNVIFAFLLAGAAIFVSWHLTRGIFMRMLQTVHSLAEPNPKLQFVNSLFREVVLLDQLQRAQALSTDKPYHLFLKESQHVQLMLDTLRVISNDNPGQLPRIDSMKTLLRERDRLLLSYLKLRSDFIRNDTLSVQIRKLSELLAADKSRFDSSVVTTEKKVTTIIEPVDSIIPESRQSFWSRLTGRKKEPEVVRMQRLIREDLNIHIDTLAIAKEDSLIQEISSGIASIGADMQQKREHLIRQQLQITRAGNMLISQVLMILQDIETEELNNVTQNNIRATTLVNTGIDRLKLIMILFITGAGVLLFLIFMDIGKSNRYRTELIAAKEEAEQLGKVKERFLSNMSHELRTPLQTIIGIAEQMQRNGRHSPEDVAVIYQSSQHLLQSVNEVLDYNRITSGRLTLETEAFDVRQAVEEVAASMKILAGQKGLEFRFSSDLDRPSMHVGDAFRLKQILYNLLGNAVKFTDKGHVAFDLKHTDHPRRTSFILAIRDTGIGIPPEDHEKIFRQFERAAPDSRQGTGLGLSIVRELVDAFRGTITLDSEPGKGSEFIVTISLPKAKEADHPAAQKGAATVQDFRDTVWVVDDDVFILKLCADILSKYKIPHRCFNTGAALLEERSRYNGSVHTILMDIRMPETDGYALLREIRGIPAFAGTRVIALTAQAMPEEREKIRTQGFDGLLTKPFLEKDLLDLFHIRQIEPVSTGIPRAPEGLFADIITMTGGDRELTCKTLNNYINETKRDIHSLQQAVLTEDREGVAVLLHRLAGRTSQMGAAEIAAALRRKELAIRDHNTPWPGGELARHTERELAELLTQAEKYTSLLQQQ